MGEIAPCSGGLYAPAAQRLGGSEPSVREEHAEEKTCRDNEAAFSIGDPDSYGLHVVKIPKGGKFNKLKQALLEPAMLQIRGYDFIG